MTSLTRSRCLHLFTTSGSSLCGAQSYRSLYENVKTIFFGLISDCSLVSLYSKGLSDRNRLAGGSHLISKFLREIEPTVSQFLNVHTPHTHFVRSESTVVRWLQITPRARGLTICVPQTQRRRSPSPPTPASCIRQACGGY